MPTAHNTFDPDQSPGQLQLKRHKVLPRPGSVRSQGPDAHDLADLEPTNPQASAETYRRWPGAATNSSHAFTHVVQQSIGVAV
ncbi:uncharacterized protein J7T54_006422 [Emericellopsis cladophorae]|uniref:Uncharacterized protein n=1 Tax=Emericellopsis cladophorae TaxID=2686198 RepID=A0A9P9Y6I1_9HYPO|nr:uncharacterized protein J7T54_006422 [Emericellopsis cladophorae]KAI6784377.1 hypothetical protein J7T54_006422 [Emericellopsis cladophorae]